MPSATSRSLLTARDEIKLRQRACAKDALTPRELADNEAQMRARVTQLWQTRLLRFSKLTVADEIENALSYYEATFLREIPRSTPTSKRALGQQPVAPFLRMGQWIGGDRDGNPNVSAPRRSSYALRRQAEVALRHYLTEVHYLGGELSLSAHAGRRVAPRCRRWPSARPTRASTASTSPTAAR